MTFTHNQLFVWWLFYNFSITVCNVCVLYSWEGNILKGNVLGGWGNQRIRGMNITVDMDFSFIKLHAPPKPRSFIYGQIYGQVCVAYLFVMLYKICSQVYEFIRSNFLFGYESSWKSGKRKKNWIKLERNGWILYWNLKW